MVNDIDKEHLLKEQIELLVRRGISQDISEHRTYISNLARNTVIAALGVLTLAAVAFNYFYGNKLNDLEHEMLPKARVTFKNKIIDATNEIDQEMKKAIKVKFDSISITLDEKLESQFNTKVREKLLNEIIDNTDSTSILNELNNKVKLLKSQINTFNNSVLGFISDKCPTGWKTYEPAFGRFLRGTDLSNTSIDPDGIRVSSINTPNLQNDLFKKHNHKGSYSILYPSGVGSQAHANLMVRGGKDSQEFKLISNGGSETRPKNVAVLFCIKIN